MNCFSFKGKSKSKQKAESSPELAGPDGPGTSSGVSVRTAKSLSSLPSTPRGIPELYKEKEHTLRVFSYEELRQATSGFNRMLKIGEGGFGSVYKGTVSPEGGRGKPLAVAIKKLNSKSLQGHKEWMSEVQFLSVVNHPNLVKLLGYCSLETERGTQLLLVYEYMANRSLDDHLLSSGSAARHIDIDTAVSDHEQSNGPKSSTGFNGPKGIAQAQAQSSRQDEKRPPFLIC